MAYYPRRYYPDYMDSPTLRPAYPSLPSGYPGTRPYYLPYDNPPAPRRSQDPPYDFDYPPNKAVPSDNPQLSAEPSPQPDSKPGDLVKVETTTQTYVVNSKYKCYGIALCILAVLSLCGEIANVVFTAFWFTTSTDIPYILTWIAPGIWGSIPVFITGILAIKVAGKNNKLVRVFALFAALSTFVFTPAIMGISIAEIILYPSIGSKPNFPDQQNGPYSCYGFNDAKTLVCPKFFLPLEVSIVAAIEFYLTMMITLIFCFCWKPGKTVTEKTSLVKDSETAEKSTEESTPVKEYPDQYPSSYPPRPSPDQYPSSYPSRPSPDQYPSSYPPRPYPGQYPSSYPPRPYRPNSIDQSPTTYYRSLPPPKPLFGPYSKKEFVFIPDPVPPTVLRASNNRPYIF